MMDSNGASNLRITVVVDNAEYDNRLKTLWGFSALIEAGDRRVLFDTGARGRPLLSNLRTLDHSPSEIDAVVISHAHWDHTGGLKTFLRNRARDQAVPLFLPLEYDPGLRKRHNAEIRFPTIGQEIVSGVSTTGTLPSKKAPEQSLVISGPRGLVVVTGCAHPGIDTIIKAVRQHWDAPIDLVIGGFHLFRSNSEDRDAMYASLAEIGFSSLAPSHCTGSNACEELSSRYGDRLFDSGVGRVFEFA
jgi:7,8-dihydropterin-6-yl-methyl-4-(beta-D-ribofuranosyl)aminobenzene 5'-phosphate synthase